MNDEIELLKKDMAEIKHLLMVADLRNLSRHQESEIAFWDQAFRDAQAFHGPNGNHAEIANAALAARRKAFPK